VNRPWFFAAWALAGVAMACVLYQPAFAALTRWWGPRRVTALTAVTLSGALAGTVFASLTAALAEHLAWHHTYLVLAAVLAAVTIPAHLFGLRGRWPRADPVEHHRHVHGAHGLIARSRAFVLLVAAIGFGTFSGLAVVVNQVPLLIGRGLSTSTAAWLSGWADSGRCSGGWATAPSPPTPACGYAGYSSSLPLPQPRCCWPCCPAAMLESRRPARGTRDVRDRARPLGRRSARRRARRLRQRLPPTGRAGSRGRHPHRRERPRSRAGEKAPTTD
jgi:MFS family permease